VTRRTRDADRALAEVLLTAFPDDAARLIETSDDAETAEFLAASTPERIMEILRRLTPDRGSRVLALLEDAQIRSALGSLNPNRAAATLARLDDADRERCLELIDEPLARDLRTLISYPPETAGSLMDPRATSFRPDATVRDVVKRLRRFRDRRNVQDVFIVDSEGRLTGAVPLQSVVLAGEGELISSLSSVTLICLQAVASQEEITQTFEEQRIGSLAVVDLDGRLIGVIRQRELIKAAQEQATASAVTMVGASEQERALSSPLFAVQKRLPWLQINPLTAFLAASVVGLFESTIAQVTALAVLLPVVAGQSGNTGAQALAVTMRGLALREVRTRQWLLVATKEALAGAGNGIAVSLTTAVAVYL